MGWTQMTHNGQNTMPGVWDKFPTGELIKNSILILNDQYTQVHIMQHVVVNKCIIKVQKQIICNFTHNLVFSLFDTILFHFTSCTASNTWAAPSE